MIAKQLVVLGCGGFIGSHLLDRLLPTDSVTIEGWDTDSHKIESHLADPRLRFHRSTIEQGGDELREAIENADVVINLAAICNPAEYNTAPLQVIRANLFDTYPIVETCARTRTWLMHFSTSEVYGRTIASYLPDSLYEDPALYELEEHTTPLVMGPIENQRWTYACAKQMVERLVYAHHREQGLPFTIVRPLNFFGPRMDYLPGRDGEGTPRVLASFTAALLDRRPMLLVDGGTARRTIVSIHDAIDAVVRMLERPAQAQNRFFNIGNPANEVSMAELADLMRHTFATVTGDRSYVDHPIQTVSALEFYGEGYEDCDRRMPSIEQAHQQLGWTPERTLAETLHETLADYYRRFRATAV